MGEALRLGLRAAVAPYLVSRLVLWSAAFAANRLLPYGPVHDPERGTWLQGFVGWDAEHYLAIARHGYPHQVIAPSGDNGYFPLLPLLLRGVGASDPAALALAFLLGFAAFVALGAFTASVREDAATARQALWAAAFWPAAFFWSAVYTESLFLVLLVACLWAAWRGRGGLAAAAGLLAALTRPDGFVLLLPLLVLLPPGRRRLAAAAPVAGTALVAAYLALHTGDALALPKAFFSHGNLSPGRPWGLVQTALLWARYGDWQQVAEVPVLVGVVALLVLLGRERRWRGPALATSGSLLLAPLAAGTVSSFARYAMVAFPVYWPLRRWPLALVLAVEIPIAVAWTVFASTGHLTP